MNLYRPNLYKKVYVVGSSCLDLFFYSTFFFAVIFIISWVICNDGHIKTDVYSHSTVFLKTQEAIRTDYKDWEFNRTYVNEKEFSLYNRVWDRTDFVIVFPNEIQFMTNMVITPNQTRRTCPDNPLIKNVECDPNKNKCKKGFKSSNGIRTGNCVPADFPLNYTHQKNNGFACEVEGWCPVDRMLVPLNDYRPVLLETINSTFYIDNSVEFPNFNIVLNNLIGDCKRYNPITNPDCPIFKLGDIIKYTKKAEESYEEMAKFGATIDINIEWKCRAKLFSSEIKTCKPKYSFSRVDVYGKRSQIIYNSLAFYNSFGNERTYIKSYRMRFAVKVKATLSSFDFFSFSVNCMAYTAIAWTIVCLLYRAFVKFMYNFIELSEKFDVSQESHRFNKVDHDSINGETSPLIL